MQDHLLANRYALLGHLGRGSDGNVSLAQDRWSGTYLAVKAPFRRTEYTLLQTIRHPQVPTCYGRCKEKGRTYLIMEWIDGVPLWEYLVQKEIIDIEEATRMFTDLCSIFQMLEEQEPPIVYADLHPGNVLRTADGRIKLIDFGRAYRVPRQRYEQIGARILCTFVDYYFLPFLERGATRRLATTWCEEWHRRLGRPGTTRVDDLASSWQHLAHSF